MKISDMCRVLQEIQREHGDLEILTDAATIKGFAIYPLDGPGKVVSILASSVPPRSPIKG